MSDALSLDPAASYGAGSPYNSDLDPQSGNEFTAASAARFQDALAEAMQARDGGNLATAAGSNTRSSQASSTADAIMQGIDARQAAGRSSDGTRVAQLVAPGMPLPPGAMPDAVPPGMARALGEAVSRAGRRLDHIGGELARGDLPDAAGHALFGRPFPPGVDDPLYIAPLSPALPAGQQGPQVVHSEGADPVAGSAPAATGTQGSAPTAPVTPQAPPPGAAFPDRELPRDANGRPTPDAEAQGPHTQLGTQTGRRGDYPQAREFDKNGQPTWDLDFTDHGRPGQQHTTPHQHRYLPNPTGGTPRRGPAEPMS